MVVARLSWKVSFQIGLRFFLMVLVLTVCEPSDRTT